MMSYQANFPSHHTFNLHVGFCTAQDSIVKKKNNNNNNNTKVHYFLFSSYYIKWHLSDKNISTHTRLKFHILLFIFWVDSELEIYFKKINPEKNLWLDIVLLWFLTPSDFPEGPRYWVKCIYDRYLKTTALG